LIDFFERFARAFLASTTMTLEMNQDKIAADIPITGMVRRGLYLSMKELLNNAVKYARAGSIYFEFEGNAQYLRILIKDNGTGFDAENVETLPGKGNGIKNIKTTIAQLNGTIAWYRAEGTEVTIFLPLK
jgi:signal transduction histidine kinase